MKHLQILNDLKKRGKKKRKNTVSGFCQMINSFHNSRLFLNISSGLVIIYISMIWKRYLILRSNLYPYRPDIFFLCVIASHCSRSMFPPSLVIHQRKQSEWTIELINEELSIILPDADMWTTNLFFMSSLKLLKLWLQVQNSHNHRKSILYSCLRCN